MFTQALRRGPILAVMKRSTRSEAVHQEDHERTGLARIPTQGGELTFCRQCSAVAPERLVRVLGAWSVIDGVAVWDCDSCARARLHEFERSSP
jgi:hypothetical protein